MAHTLVRLNMWDSLVADSMNALLMPYVIFIAVVLAFLLIAYLVMRQVADWIEEPLEYVTEKLYKWCNLVVAPVRFLWTTVYRWMDALVDRILGKPNENRRQKEKWGAFFRAVPIVLMLVVIVSAVLHQMAIGRLETFVSNAIDALPVSYFFAVAESFLMGGTAVFSLVSLTEMLMCSVLALILMRRADDEKNGTRRFAHKLIFLLFTIVVVQYLPPEVEQWVNSWWELGATIFVDGGLVQFLLPWNMILLYFYVVFIFHAAREIVSTLSFSVTSVLDPEDEGAGRVKRLISDVKLMANPTMVVIFLNVILLILRFVPVIPTWILLAVEVVVTLVCTIWYTNISMEKEDEMQEELDADLMERDDKARERVQTKQLKNLRRDAEIAQAAGGSGITPFGPPSQATLENVRKRQLRTCGEHCPYYHGKKKGVCRRKVAFCKRHEFCTLGEVATTPNPPPNVEDLRYRQDGRALIVLLLFLCVPFALFAICAVANEWLISLRVNGGFLGV